MSIKELGMQVAGGAISEGYGMLDEAIMGDKRRRNQLEQQKKLNQQQYDMNMKMWEETNYAAQMEQIKKAGLNPAMIYAGGGDGGSTGNIGTSQASDEAEQSKAQSAKQGIGIESAMMQAQIENLEANTRKTNVEADRSAGIETEEIQASINNLLQETNNKQLQAKGLEIDNEYKLIESKILRDTSNAQIESIVNAVEKQKEEIRRLINENDITEETKNEIIKNAELQNEMIASNILNNSVDNMLSQQQAMKLIADIKRDLKSLELTESGQTIDIFKTTSGNEIKINELTEKIRHNLIEEGISNKVADKMSIGQAGGKVMQAIANIINMPISAISPKYKEAIK